MARWHHRLNGCEFEWTPGFGDGQGGLACCDSWGRKESNTTEWLNWSLTQPLLPLFKNSCQLLITNQLSLISLATDSNYFWRVHWTLFSTSLQIEVAMLLNLINNIKQKLLGWIYGKDPQKRSDSFYFSSLSPSILIFLECGCDD